MAESYETINHYQTITISTSATPGKRLKFVVTIQSRAAVLDTSMSVSPAGKLTSAKRVREKRFPHVNNIPRCFSVYDCEKARQFCYIPRGRYLLEVVYQWTAFHLAAQIRVAHPSVCMLLATIQFEHCNTFTTDLLLSACAWRNSSLINHKHIKKTWWRNRWDVGNLCEM